jgi:signal transduction histidine kinase
VVGLSVVLLGGTEWLHTFSRPSDLLTGAAALVSAVLLWPFRDWRRQLTASLLVVLAGVVLLTQRRLDRVEGGWSDEREARVAHAGERLAGDLHAAYQRTQELASIGVDAATLDRDAAFRVLAQNISARGPEAGLVILEADGSPWAWAGSHRLPPLAAGDSIAAASNQYYVTLESRRHLSDGRVVVGSVLIWAHPAVPERGRSVAERFRERTSVSLAVYPAGTAPDNTDVFDYCEPTPDGERCLFSAQPLPPLQADARAIEINRNGRAAALLVTLVAALALLNATTPLLRTWFVLLSFWLLFHAPVGALWGAAVQFSPEAYFFGNMGTLASSAGALGLAAALVTIGAAWLWRLRLPRRWWTTVPALLLFAAVPFTTSDLSRGITPPTDGTSVALWLTWYLALFLAAAGPLVLAAALLRGSGPPDAKRGWALAGAAAVALTAVVGLAVWSPAHDWPDWFRWLWAAALLIVVVPLSAMRTIATVGIAAGSLSGLFVWQAEQRGSMAAARRETDRLGASPDPVAPRLLERLAERARELEPPPTPTGLYALWQSSILSDQGYPAQLGVWNATEGWTAVLPLDSLAVPDSAIATLLAPGPAPDSVVAIDGFPGVHYVSVTPFANGDLLVVIVGPRSSLVSPGSLGRLLQPRQRGVAPYLLALSPPTTGFAPEGTGWRREGWVIRNQQELSVAGTSRRLLSQVALGSPGPLLVRGVLLLILGAGVLACLWVVADYCSGHRPQWSSRRLDRSFRARLALTLALFFGLPAVGFALWGIDRIRREPVRVSDALVANTLRQALQSVGDLAQNGAAAAGAELQGLSTRMEAEFALYRGGALSAASADLLSDLGLLGHLMDASAFRQLAFGGQVQVTRDGPAPALAERVGYRLVRPGVPEELGVLATPLTTRDAATDSRDDLLMVAILALLIGLAAALWSARLAAASLIRPVAELRDAALALGRGSSMRLEPASAPGEFEPVFGAFVRMEADIEASRRALEEARLRTERVLATVSTGVVALDARGRVLLANARAAELLGGAPIAGERLAAHLGPDWAALGEQLGRALAGEATEAVESTTADRRVTAELTALPGPGGVVVALTDVTDLSRAERVLAWGEMARQVAHEIKNPLTPMRLGMQHLRRAWQDQRGDYGEVLGDTSERILAEIERLDMVARAFSRFGAPGVSEQPVEVVDLTAAAREIVQLYALSDEGTRVVLRDGPRVQGQARVDEFKEVLVNLLENARAAGAALIAVAIEPGRVTVSDDGRGIPSDLLPRVFEPQFSTTTSGSGLGLSIVRRLVESWDGTVSLASQEGKGTQVTIRVVSPASP